MSALDGWIDICRAGDWRDMAGRDVRLDEDRLDRIVAAQAAADPAPVVVGHPEANAPAFGWVDSLRRVGDRLQAKLRDISAPFREAVEAGRYAGRSIALQGDTLRHLGFLGGRAPAVPGLAPTQFAAEAETVIAFADAALAAGPVERRAFGAMTRIARGFRENIIARDGVEAADAANPPAETDAAPAFAAADVRAPSGATPDPMPETEHPEHNRQEGAMPKTEAELAAESAALDERRAELERDQATLAEGTAALATREAEQAARDRLHRADAALAPHVEAGRVLPAERAGLAALLASLPAGDDATLTFAGPDGTAEVSEAPRAIFDRFLAALPERVDFGTRAGGTAPADAAEDNEAIVAEARDLMAEATAKGQTLTHGQAVDQARAKRGLPTGKDAQ